MKLKELLHGLDVLELHADETLDITGVHLAGTIPGKRVERQVQQLAGRIRLIPGEIQTQAVLQETHVETGFP